MSAEFVTSCARERAQGTAIPPTDSYSSETSDSVAGHGSSASPDSSQYTVSEREAMFYYSGISPDPPKLLFRTGATRTPWFEPTGPEAYRRLKQARGVFGHTLNKVWDNDIGPKVRDLLCARNVAWTSIDVVRFVTDGGGGEKIAGPVVIWVGVSPNSLKGKDAFITSQHILNLLADNNITDVEVEYRESIYTPSTGPELLPYVFDVDHTASVRGPLTTALGLQIAACDQQDVEGTMGLYFAEDANNDKILGLTCRHVLFNGDENANDDYIFTGNDDPPKHVQLLGTRAFTELLDTIKSCIRNHVTNKQLYEEDWIPELKEEAKDGSTEAARRLQRAVWRLNKVSNAITSLEAFYAKVKSEWGPTEMRIIGHIRFSPAMTHNAASFGGFTEDWCVFELDKSKFKTHFNGNFIDLGTKIWSSDFTKKMCPRNDGQPTFEYPDDRLLPLRGIIPEDDMHKPNTQDHDNKPSFFVIKSGNATGVTIGRATGPFSFVRTDLSSQGSKAWAIYNYGDKEYASFSAPGDSGSVIVDGLGRLGGLLTGGAGESGTDVTYATPMWWLWPRIKSHFPNAHLDPTSMN